MEEEEGCLYRYKERKPEGECKCTNTCTYITHFKIYVCVRKARRNVARLFWFRGWDCPGRSYPSGEIKAVLKWNPSNRRLKGGSPRAKADYEFFVRLTPAYPRLRWPRGNRKSEWILIPTEPTFTPYLLPHRRGPFSSCKSSFLNSSHPHNFLSRGNRSVLVKSELKLSIAHKSQELVLLSFILNHQIQHP